MRISPETGSSRRLPRKSTALWGVLAGAFLTGAATAQSPTSPLCDTRLEMDALVGDFVLTVGPSTLYGNGNAVPLAQVSTTSVTLDLHGNSLMMSGNGAEVSLDWVGADEPGWEFSPPTREPSISSDDLERVAGCATERLPRLIGHGQAISEEGIPIHFTYRLIVTGTGDLAGMLGGLDWSGGDTRLVSRVSLTR